MTHVCPSSVTPSSRCPWVPPSVFAVLFPEINISKYFFFFGSIPLGGGPRSELIGPPSMQM